MSDLITAAHEAAGFNDYGHADMFMEGGRWLAARILEKAREKLAKHGAVYLEIEDLEAIIKELTE